MEAESMSFSVLVGHFNVGIKVGVLARAGEETGGQFVGKPCV